MKLKKEAMEALQAEIIGCLQPGDELVTVGAIALAGTELLVKHRQEVLKPYFSRGFLYQAENLCRDYGIRLEGQEGCVDLAVVWQLADEAGASARYAMGEGGFLSALWKMAEASQVGLEADLRKVPIRQETIEICEIFDLNPYRLYAGGAALIGVRGGEALAAALMRMGVPAAVIGQTNSGNDRLLYSGGKARYLDRPVGDEIKGVIDTWQN
jgi:hydrogenase maturation factor